MSALSGNAGHLTYQRTPRCRRASPNPAGSVPLFISVCLLCALASSERLMAEDARLAELRAGYIQTVTSLSPVWTRCLWNRTFKASKPEEARPSLGDPSGVMLDWAQDGRRFHYQEQGGGPTERPKWISCDGPSVWSLGYEKLEERHELTHVMRQSLETATDWEVRCHRSPANWLGLYFNISPQQQTGATLATLLKQAEGVEVVDDEVDGHPCWKVELPFKTARPGEIFPVAAWFDPQAGYLPRQILPKFSVTGFSDVYRVQSFRQVTQEGVKPVLWFPERMTVENRLAVDELALQDVKFGDPLELNLFRPEVPKGVQVYDLDDEQQSARSDQLQIPPCTRTQDGGVSSRERGRGNATGRAAGGSNTADCGCARSPGELGDGAGGHGAADAGGGNDSGFARGPCDVMLGNLSREGCAMSAKSLLSAWVFVLLVCGTMMQLQLKTLAEHQCVKSGPVAENSHPCSECLYDYEFEMWRQCNPSPDPVDQGCVEPTSTDGILCDQASPDCWGEQVYWSDSYCTGMQFITNWPCEDRYYLDAWWWDDGDEPECGLTI